MKKIFALIAVLFFCASVIFAAQHPLIGKWRFGFVIGNTRFYECVTITTVNIKTKKVFGYDTNYPNNKLTGYYNENIVFLMDSNENLYTDGFYFTFQGTKLFRKHLGISSIQNDFDASWHSLSITKLSNSIVPAKTMTLSDVLNQKALKQQAQLRERMMLNPPR